MGRAASSGIALPADTGSQASGLSPGMRRWLLLDAFLVFVTGIQCFVFARYTDDFFAWTIRPPLTAAFLGASYWAAFPLVLLSAREQAWARARVAVYGVLVFTSVTTVATLLHLDRFHLDSDRPVPLMAAWAWLLVYVFVPPSLLVLLFQQERAAGGDPVRERRLAPMFRGVLALQAGVMLAVGVVLFLAPEAKWWPWQLSPLTGQAIAAWPIGIGITIAHAAWEDDWTRLRAGMVSYLLLGMLQLVAVLRFEAAMQWSEPGASLYVAFLAAVAATGTYGTFEAWRHPR